MIFAETWSLVLSGRKTQTRRRRTIGRDCAYRVGYTYSVQPGRGQKAIGRIRVLEVRSEPLWKLSDEDVLREGIARRNEFVVWWKRLYGEVNWDEHVWVITFELAQ